MGASVFFAASSELATLTNEFFVNNVATDPTTITLAITSPAGVATSYTYAGATITKTATGIYTKDVDVSSESGTWQYVWTGTGTASDVQEGTFQVFDTQLGHLYFSVDDLKSRLGLSDTVDDYEMHAACFAASRHVENVCQRLFWRTATDDTRTFVACDFYTLDLPVFNDLVSVTSLKTDPGGTGTFGAAWQATDYQLWPTNPQAYPESRPYTTIKAVGGQVFPVWPTWKTARADRVQIVGKFGWPAVPLAVRTATGILAAEIFKLKDAPFGVAGFGDLGIVRIKDNPAVERYLAPYKRQPFLVG